MINTQQTKNNCSKKQATSVNQKATISMPQLFQLSIEELNKVTGGGPGSGGSGGFLRTYIEL